MSRWLWTAELWTPVAASANISGGARRRLADRLQEGLEFLGSRRVAQLAQGFRFDLPDSFPGYVEGAADLFEGVLRAVADAETHLQDLLFARRQGLQDPSRLILEVRHQDRLDWREHSTVLDEVAQMRILFLSDRRLERDRLLRDLHDLADLGDRHVHALGDLLGVGLPSQLLHERARGARQLVDRLDHVDRDADRARLIRDRAGDRLADPPGRIRRELVAAAVLELLDGFHQADVAFLDQVQELKTPVGVLLGDGDDEAQVRDDQLVLGLVRFLFSLADHPQGLLDVLVRDAELLLELLERLTVLGDAALVEVDPRRVLLFLQGVGVLADRGLRGRHLPVDVLEDSDGAVQDGRREVGRADQLGHRGDLLVDGGLDAGEALCAALDRARLELQPFDVLVQGADLLEAPQHPLDSLGGAVVQIFFLVVGNVDELGDHAGIAAGVFQELQQLFENNGVVGERLVDLCLALLDALGDSDLALAVEELDRPHLAQVHAHRVVGLFDRLAGFFRGLRLERGALPRGPVGIGDNLDAQVEEARVDLFQVLGLACHFIGEDRLDLLVEQVALLLAHLEEDLNLRILFLNQQP